MNWNTVIFDLDGTLLNSVEDIRNSVNYTMRQMGFQEKTYHEIKLAVGNGVEHLISCCMPPAAKAELSIYHRALEIFREHYMLHAQEKTTPYKGVEELISCLVQRGVKTAIVSNKPDEVTQKVVKQFFDNKIAYISGEKKGIDRKPAPDLVLEAMHILGSAPSDTVYVGDSEVDLMTAQNAKIPVILVSWGYRDRKALEDLCPDYLVDDIEELTLLIVGLQEEFVREREENL